MKKFLFISLILFGLILQACGTSTTQVAIEPAVTTSASIPTEPIVTPIVHITIPTEGIVARASAHDNEQSTTSGNKDVIFGDDFANNRFERPFTANDMVYQPDIDIVDFEISSDDNFFYIRIILADVDLATQSLTGSYGIEFDKNGDGRAEIMLAATAPYNTEFTADNVYLFIDANGDIGGDQVARPDINIGDGYDSVLFALVKGIHPEDPDLAWVRFVNEGTKPAIEFAYKKWLFKDGNENFMWGVWASSALLDPTIFNWHDHFTEADAGSPTKANPNYPINLLASIDNTCRVPFGYEATGFEPLSCATNPASQAGEEPAEIEFCAQFPTACQRLPEPPPLEILEGFDLIKD